MPDYLHPCLGLHGDLTELLYNQRQDLSAMKRVSWRIRSSPRLTYEDSQQIADSTQRNPRTFCR